MVFIDSRLPDFQQIVDAVKPGITVVVLDKDLDGVQQVADALKNCSNLDSISIISHGDNGVMLLGSAVLHDGDMASYQSQLQAIGASLKPGGDLMLYGCNIGAGPAGSRFINDLASMTGADVAASTNDTGAAIQNGDWQLEISTGKIETKSALDIQKLTDWNHLAATLSASDLASLQAAMATANSNGRDDTLTLTGDILFTASNNTISIAADSGHSLTIIGSKNNAGGVVTISGGNLTRVIDVAAGATASLENLVITNGLAAGNGGDNTGNLDGPGRAGLDGAGGGIRNAGTLTISNSTITANKASGGGGTGGGYPKGGGGGGGGGYGAGLGGIGGMDRIGEAPTAPSAGHGGNGSGTSGGQRGGYGGSTTGGAGGGAHVQFLGSSYTLGGAGASASNGAISIGGGGGGSGGIYVGGTGGNAVGGIFNSGTLRITSSVITNNLAAGGGGGGGAASNYTNHGNGGAGGNGIGGIWSTGTLLMDTASVASLGTGNKGAGGFGGTASGTGNIAGTNGNSIDASLGTITAYSTPATVNIALSKPTLKAGDTQDVTFTFSEAVSDFGTADIYIANGILSGLQTANNITFTATFTPNTNFESASNVISVNLPGTYNSTHTPGVGITSSSNFVVDTKAPTLIISSNVSALKAGETATISFAFSEVPTGFTAVDISVTGGSLGSLNGSGTTRTATFTPDPATNAGSASITVASGSYTDAAGNSGGAGNSPALTFDTGTPAVSTVSVPANATYATTQNLNFTVNFNEAVIVTGTPSLPVMLDTGGNVAATYISGSGSSSLLFGYTIVDGNQDSNGISVGGSVTLNGGTIKDGAGNNAALNLNGVASTAAVNVDGIAPAVSTVTVPANATYVPGQGLNFTVNFNEVVNVTGTPTIPVTLDTGGTVAATYVSGSGTSALLFRYTVVSGNLDTNGISLGSSITLNSGSIKDTVGNNAALNLNSVGSTNAVMVDGVAPTITSINRASASPSNSSFVDFQVTFSESVANGGLDISDFALVTTGAASGNIASLSGPVGNVWTVRVNTISGDGTLGLNFKNSGTGVTDVAGNAIVGGHTGDELYTLDNSGPAVMNVSSSTANATYAAGTVIPVTITFNETVNVTGTPQLTLETGTIDRVINYVSGSGTNTITFNYTVQVGDVSADLDYQSSTALRLNGGTIKDSLGNNATLTLAAPGAASSLGSNKAIVIYTNSPPAIGGALAGQTVTETTTVSPFTGVTINDPDVGASETIIISLDLAAKGAFTAASLAATGFSTADGGLTYTHAAGTPAAVQAAIRGLVFQPAAGRVPVGNTETTTFTISANDGIASAVLNNTTTVIATGINAAPTNISLSNAAIQQGSTANTSVGTLLVTDPNPGDTASFTLVTGNGANDRDNAKFVISGNSLVAKNPLSMTPGNYTIFVRATDGSGAAYEKSLVIAVGDNVAPVATGITRLQPENNNLTSVDYKVSFSEAVTGVNAAAFTLATTGTVAGTISNVTQLDSSTYIVRITGLTGDGTLGLNLRNAGTGIVDTTSLALSGGFTEQLYQVDHTAPTTNISSVRLSNDDGISGTDFVTTAPQQTISGSLSNGLVAGETVQVSIDNGANWLNATSVAGSTSWSLQNQTLGGNNTLKVRVTDLAGNGGAVLQQAYSILTYDNSMGTNPSDNTIPATGPDADGDGILQTIEAGVPNWIGSGKGDGNGDGKADQAQKEVGSLPWNNGGLVNTHYATLSSNQALALSNITTTASPADLSKDLQLQYGLINGQISGVGAGKDVSLSLYTDKLGTVNGYWVQDRAGNWTNIASAITEVNGKLKVDFKITDGGMFDADGKADGKISFSGGLGVKTSSLPGDKDGDGIPDAIEVKVGTNQNQKDNDVLHRADLFVMQLYRDVLFREGDTAGITYWQQQIDSGHLNRTQVAASMLASTEFQNNVGSLTRLYFGAFDRLPDRDGLAYWIGQEKAGASLSGISGAFVASAEFQNAYGNLNNTTFVDRVYHNVLHRTADAAGQAYWLGQLNNGLSRGDMLAGFTESAEFKVNSQSKVSLTLDYIGLLGHAPDQATFDTLLSQSGTDVVTLIGQFINSPEYLARFIG
ncbi:DUF4347 domain-containing protein [Undibacterium sp. KW1]|uniref:DUF4347 domain-containing protein n=1 Tax=Undibacterium sp. KW1 TaxID=2058624 RepID=UPI001389F870|nr:DUF4347 domain-containing protein [Undibacterium sp. KW1]